MLAWGRVEGSGTRLRTRLVTSTRSIASSSTSPSSSSWLSSFWLLSRVRRWTHTHTHKYTSTKSICFPLLSHCTSWDLFFLLVAHRYQTFSQANFPKFCKKNNLIQSTVTQQKAAHVEFPDFVHGGSVVIFKVVWPIKKNIYKIWLTFVFILNWAAFKWGSPCGSG